ncbi:MAG: anthranilate synthase component I family protein [Flavobacteriales bacterium]
MMHRRMAAHDPLLLSWPGTINWQALAVHRRFLARRVADEDRWYILLAPDDAVVRDGPVPGDGRWWFGHIGYDEKNELEDLHSRHPAQDGFAQRGWICASVAIELGGGHAVLHAEEVHRKEGERLLRALLAPPVDVPAPPFVQWDRHTSHAQYIEYLRRLLGHIQRGDIYEINYCTQRTARLPGFDPYGAFARLLAHSDAPFAGFYRLADRYALCASPERFLRIDGDRVIAQPMKGTRPRNADPGRDTALAHELATDAKERSENIMALDVARNDLSRIAASGTVQVDELCAVKSYRNVHQLVSTVSARLRSDCSPMDAVRVSFPMASMTGAPKLRAMQLIDEVEDMRRGLFSGTLGFFKPDGSADLNVVIRTVTYEATTGRASLISGGAITNASDPQAEWEECELKARSVLNAFGHAC